MTDREQLLDFILALNLVKEPLSDYPEYETLTSLLSKDYLDQLKHFQQALTTLEDWPFFINDGYHIPLAYLSAQTSLQSFSQFIDGLDSLSSQEFQELVSKAAFDGVSDNLSFDAINQSNLSKLNKWHVSSLIFNAKQEQKKLVDLLNVSWQLYEEHLKTSLSLLEQSQLTWPKQADVYNKVCQAYISLEQFEHCQERLLLPSLAHKFFYLQTPRANVMAMGPFTVSYFEHLNRQTHYSQEVREQVLKTLADPTRFGILNFINDGIWSNKVIAQRFNISSAAVSYQLKHLVEHEIILFDSNLRTYSLNKTKLSHVLEDIKKELNLENSNN